MKNGNAVLQLLFIVLIGIGVYLIFGHLNTSPSSDVKPNTQVQATTVQVAKFYDGKEGYSLSIPTGNTSTCIWNYTGGSAAIPYSQTTIARTATEKHTIYSYDYYEWKVTCVDDFGNQYVGVFPK